MLTLRWGSATDVGRVRTLNEDSVLAVPGLFVVADGMGGHAAGEVASQLAVAEFARLAEQAPAVSVRAEDLTETVRRANEHILTAGAERGDRYGMGTTLTGLGVVGGRARASSWRCSTSATRGSTGSPAAGSTSSPWTTRRSRNSSTPAG